MRNSHKFLAICILGIFVIAGCSKANAPTNSNFTLAIKKYIKQHPQAPQFQIMQGIPLEVKYDSVGNKPVNMSDINLFNLLLNKGVFIKDRIEYRNLSTTKTEENPNYSQEESKYEKKLQEYHTALAVWKKRDADWKKKVQKIQNAYNMAAKQYTDQVISPKIQWCASRNGNLYGNDQTYCQAVQQGISGVKNVLSYDQQNMLTFLGGSAPPPDPIFPQEPLRPRAPNGSVPSKTLQVIKTKKVPTYIWYKLVQNNPMVSCSPGNPFYAGLCSVNVGSYVFDKVLDSTAPSTNADGMIVSYVTAQFHPVMRIGTSGPIKNIKFAIVQETNGWRVGGLP